MSLRITCSDYGLGIGNVFDKITHEYDPPSFWVRLEISSNAIHKKCMAEITQVWNADGKDINGIDPIKMFWISEPVNDVRKEKTDHYSPTIYPQKSEIVGMVHIKLSSKYRDKELEIPENNTPADEVPEVKIDSSRQENKLASKKMSLPYGIYYFSIMVIDEMGESVSEIFKIWAYPDPKKCSIRTLWFWEKWKISYNEFLGRCISLGTGLPKKKKISQKKNIQNIKKSVKKNMKETGKQKKTKTCLSQNFKKEYNNKILEIL